MSKYETLRKVLDGIIKEAPSALTYYNNFVTNELKERAISRAYIHLFLKVKFGLINFKEREEKYLTDGSYDGGIDAFYIDKNSFVIYIIQSKFRFTEQNFQEKSMDLMEILKMDIKRITKGIEEDENGNKYSGKIKAFQGKIRELGDQLPRYDYKIVLLANIDKTLVTSHLEKLFDGFPIDVYDYEKSYNELLFPVTLGTFFNASDLTITLDVSDNKKDQIVSHIANIENEQCIIRVVFAPTLEIARAMSKYKNAILKYNPRCFLELKNNPVNIAIKSSILETNTNEFSIYNNGITIIADNARYGEFTAKAGETQLLIINPQIINGGQTAYTLSRVYDDHSNDDVKLKEIFSKKEVLVKVIFFPDLKDPLKKLKLIEQISKATNQQSPIEDIDRISNDEIQIIYQERIFKEFALFYERKKGEFADAVRNDYIKESEIIKIDSFLRIIVAASGNPILPKGAFRKFYKHILKDNLMTTDNIKKYIFAYYCYLKIDNYFQKPVPNVLEMIPAHGKYAVVMVAVFKYFTNSFEVKDLQSKAEEATFKVLDKWESFGLFILNKNENSNYFKKNTEPDGKEIIQTNYANYFKSKNLIVDLKEYMDQFT